LGFVPGREPWSQKKNERMCEKKDTAERGGGEPNFGRSKCEGKRKKGLGYKGKRNIFRVFKCGLSKKSAPRLTGTPAQNEDGLNLKRRHKCITPDSVGRPDSHV